jgi:hypothetical protein
LCAHCPTQDACETDSDGTLSPSKLAKLFANRELAQAAAQKIATKQEGKSPPGDRIFYEAPEADALDGLLAPREVAVHGSKLTAASLVLGFLTSDQFAAKSQWEAAVVSLAAMPAGALS